MPAGRPGPGLDTSSSPHVSSLHKRTEHFAWHLGESPSSGQHRQVCSVIQDFPGNQDVQLPFLFFIFYPETVGFTSAKGVFAEGWL